MIHFDTNILSYLMRRPPEPLEKRIKQSVSRGDELAMSAIVYAEIQSGLVFAGRPQRYVVSFNELSQWLPIVPWSTDAADAYAELRASLTRSGEPIGAMDMLIAAHALAIDATLVTNNEREFKRIPGLKVENWTK
jgi:tRNA(fMet)-specific endonuclease VapC